MTPDAALAVLRHSIRSEAEADAYDRVAGELATLRIQRAAVLDLAGQWDVLALRQNGRMLVAPLTRVLREALGVFL